MTKEDFANYKVRVNDGVLLNSHFRGDLVMCGGPPPSSFAVTQLIVSIMSSKHMENIVTNTLRTLSRGSPWRYSFRCQDHSSFSRSYEIRLCSKVYIKIISRIAFVEPCLEITTLWIRQRRWPKI